MMKRFVPLILFAALYCSCNNDQQSTDKPLNQSATLIQQFKPIIQGVWVKKDYIKKVKKSKSPLEAAEKSKGITLMQIDTQKMSGENIEVPLIRDNHEAGKETLTFEPGRNTTTIMFGKDELSYKLKKDTTLIIYHYNADTRETDLNQYIKVSDKAPASGFAAGMDVAINQAIIAGRYEGTDASGKKIAVTFTDDGKVSGLPGLSTYFVQNYFGAHPESGHDQLIFNQGAPGQKVYSFILHKKALRLYNDAAQIKSNKPSFTLNRKR
ncbi:hypothetical protein [Mucilaginibacter sp.]|uniref:hypothetical protein n=1 Tax=Mucilaginibacter sp. TaxID=1882438 RepID=UPI0018384686|nr:hypothetical protein [Mucilaginibacter sp.]HEK20534.1 hypothetical protein [Bacteroidota bacterium]